MDLQFTYISPSITRLGGYSVEEAMGKSLEEILTPASFEVARKAFAGALVKLNMGRSSLSDEMLLELEHVLKDGSTRWTEVKTVFLAGPDGQPIGIVGVTRDIAERKQMEQALWEAAQQWRTTFDAISDAVCLLDHGGRILRCNTAMKQLLGKPFSKINGRLCWELMHGTSGPIENCPVVRMKETLRSEVSVIPMGDKVLEVSVDPLKDSNGNLIGAVHVISDITKRKRAEEALLESEARFRSIVENSHEGIHILDENYRYIYVNDELCRIHGCSREELIGHDFREFLSEEGKKIVTERHKRRDMGEEVPSRYQFPIQRKNGEQRLVEVSSSKVKDLEGKIRTVVQVLDITERKRTEAALGESEKKYRSLFEESRDALYVTTRDGKLVDANQAYLGLFGYTREEAMGMNVLATYIDPDDRLRFQQEIEPKGEIKDYEIKLRKKDGEEMHCLLSASVRRDENGEIMGYHGSIRDITEQRRMEERERELQRELILSSRLASIGEMASGIAHEINNPLTGVIGYAQLLGQKDVPDDIREAVDVINEGGQRVAEIVQKLLTFARQSKVEKEYADINSVIESVLDMRSYEMKTSNIEVKTNFASKLPKTMVNVGQLQQVFLNIVINAEQAMITANGKGKLSVKTEKKDNSIRVSITDNGPGISKEDMDKLFDPFFTGRDSGTGLGLSIAYGIMRDHKGKVYAKSTLKKGATFTVEVPIVADADEAAVVEAPPPRKPKRAVKGRIMVVDDEPSICQFLGRLLTEEGHKVETILGAQTALQRMSIADYDLFLLDIKMPGMSGVELYQRMKEIAPSLQNRVIFLTGEVLSPRTKAFLSRNRAPYLTKPIDLEQLKKEIERKLS